MNKKILLLINLSLLTFYCYGQVYHKESEQWLRMYPLSATQFEQNEDINGTFEFGYGFENLANSMFLPIDNVEHNKQNVSLLNITKYIQTTKFDEIIWEEMDVMKIQFREEGVLVNGQQPSYECFSVLDSKGQKEKLYKNIRLKYRRDEIGRVEMIFIYDRYDLNTLYKYTYGHPNNTNKITQIERFSHLGERLETIKFVYDGENIASASWENSDARISMKFTYDTFGNPISILRSNDDRIYNRTETTEYKLSYEYSGDKISSCTCRFGEQSDQYKKWNFKYDDNGNWLEMEIPTSGVRYIREIVYK